MLKIIQENLFQNCKADIKSKFILAVSGGIDSMVLCHVFQQLNLQFVIAHCNFKLRAEAADEDALFVEKLALQFSKPFFSIEFETEKYAVANKLSIQMAARELRYDWLEKIRQENQAQFIVTAHHANDQAETIFMNIIKGTGLNGLSGMAFKNNYLLRPMLTISKDEILIYAKKYKVEKREDESNKSDKYLRNNIRLNMLPIAEKINPNFHNEIIQFSNRIDEIKEIYNIGLEVITKKIEQKKGNDIYLPIRLLNKKKSAKTILFEMLKKYDFSPAQSAEVYELLSKDSGKQVSSKTYRVLKDRNHLIITHLDNIDNSTVYQISKERMKVKTPAFLLDVSMKKAGKYQPEFRPKVAVFDAEKVVFPLTIRKWKAGDYFYPFGMTKMNSEKIGKKKLKKFFTDIKLSIRDKEKAWVIQDAQDRILWIVGLRTDARFSISEKTKKILRLQLTHVAKDYPLNQK